MMAVRRILCPTDFSQASRRALDHAIALARWYESELVVLHVLPLAPAPVVFPPMVSSVALAPVPRERFLGDLRRSSALAADAGVRSDAILGEGSAAGEILGLARSLPADLVVMGTHGRGALERLVLGSVAQKVVRRSCCPVLTVPPAADPPPAAPSPPFTRILCACDFSPASTRALAWALSLAQEARASLTALHVLEWSPGVAIRQDRHFDVDGYRRYLVEEGRGLLTAAIPEEARLWCDVHEVVGQGRVHLEIERIAREGKADIVVMGAQGQGPAGLTLFGSTTRHVIRGSGVPVLTVGAQAGITRSQDQPSEDMTPPSARTITVA